jgi:hypothetical protein
MYEYSVKLNIFICFIKYSTGTIWKFSLSRFNTYVWKNTLQFLFHFYSILLYFISFYFRLWWWISFSDDLFGTVLWTSKRVKSMPNWPEQIVLNQLPLWNSTTKNWHKYTFQGLHKDCTGIPGELHEESLWVLKESSRNPCGWFSKNTRTLQGVWEDSSGMAQGAQGFLRDPWGSVTYCTSLLLFYSGILTSAFVSPWHMSLEHSIGSS